MNWSRPKTKVLLLACLLVTGCKDSSTEQPSSPPQAQTANLLAESANERYAEDRFYIAHDLFRAADQPRLVSLAHADRFLRPDDEILGFVLDGEARAYSVQMLCYHHVVNDVIGKTPIAVTY